MHTTRTSLLVEKVALVVLILFGVYAFAQQGSLNASSSQKWAKLNDGPPPARAMDQRLVMGANRRPVDCSIVQWLNTATVPVLKMSCPPEQVFAPVHVYLEFSWETTDQTPADSQSYVALPKTPSRVLANDRGILVWLRKLDGHGEWVRFTSIRRIALLTDP